MRTGIFLFSLLVIMTPGLLNAADSEQAESHLNGSRFIDDPDLQQDVLTIELMEWVAQHSGIEEDIPEPPVIKTTSGNNLANMAFAGDILVLVRNLAESILGLFNDQENTIYLNEKVNLDTPEGRGILLHELVHYLEHELHPVSSNMQVHYNETIARQLEQEYLKQFQK